MNHLPDKKLIRYAEYILNHYDKNSHSDAIVLARDLARKGLTISEWTYYVCWYNTITNQPEHQTFTEKSKAKAFADAIRLNPYVQEVRVAVAEKDDIEKEILQDENN